VLTTCPSCRGPLTPQPGAKPVGETAESYSECARVCLNCEIALSNARKPTFIRCDWRDGLWRRDTAGRLNRIVAGSLSEGTREKKLARLAHERSEGLLTWNVFSWLEDRGLLGRVVSLIRGQESPGKVDILYWGFNDRDAGYAARTIAELRGLLTETFREPRLSEPDVILVSDTSLVFVEAKFDSPNDRQPGKDVDRYVRRVPDWFVAEDRVQSAGYYELTRNWAIGAALAEKLSKDFTLVNLVRHGSEEDIERDFPALITSRGHFKRLEWEDLVDAVEPALIAHLQHETLYFEPAFSTLGVKRPPV